VARFAQLPPERQREGAILSLRWHHDILPPRPTQQVKVARFGYSGVTDEELGLLAAVPELEELYLAAGTNLTPAGLRHLARFPNLKKVVSERSPADSLAPFVSCPGLEDLEVVFEGSTEVGDEHTAGLEQLSNLRRLVLRGCRLGSPTVWRLAGLRKLQSLELDLWPLEDEDCLAVLAELTELERLALNAWVSDGPLRHIVGLTNLRALSLYGKGVTDASVRCLTTLTRLRTLMARGTAISEGAARTLAGQLPAVTIVLDQCVVKSPRESLAFRRRAASPFASALFPTHWVDDPQNECAVDSMSVLEDGWEWERGAEIEMDMARKADAESAATALAWWRRGWGPDAVPVEPGPVALDGTDTACCTFQDRGERYLVLAAAAGGSAVVLACKAATVRFEEFRPLFEFVARSLRVGPAAAEGVGEQIEVEAARL
jgi:hypothetical protein